MFKAILRNSEMLEISWLVTILSLEHKPEQYSTILLNTKMVSLHRSVYL